MPFDITTAKPLKQSGKFDITTAKPVKQNEPTKRPDLINTIAGISPEESKFAGIEALKAGDTGLSNRLLASSAIQSAGKDLLTIPAHYFNQYLLNFPRSITRTLGYEYPEKASTGNFQRGAMAAGVAGMVTSPLLRGISTLGKGNAILQAPLRQKMIAGGLTGLAYAPNEDVVGLKERAVQGVLGATLPLIPAGAMKAKTALGKFIAPLKKFTPDIQKFAKERLNIPIGAIETVKKKGIDIIHKIRENYDDMTDWATQKIEKGFANKERFADEAYHTAVSQTPEGKFINIKPAIDEAGNKLKKLGLITDSGKLTELGKSEISRDSVYGKLLDFYQSSNAISGIEALQQKESLTLGQITKLSKARRETLVNKDQFMFFRDKLNSLYKGKPSDIDVNSVVNKFYESGENSGIKGLQNARRLQREVFQAQDRFKESLKGQRKLDNFQKLTEAEKRELREIEKYIGDPFVDDIDAITADRAMDKMRLHYQKRNAKIRNTGIVTAGLLGGLSGLRGLSGLLKRE